MDERPLMRGLAKHQSWSDGAVFEDTKAAKTVKKFLADQGVAARSYDDKLFRYFLFLRPPRVTLRAQVRKDKVKAAVDFLTADPPAALQKAIRCPSCGSLSVSYPQMTRKFMLPTIMLHLGIIFRLLDHECYCEHCHYIWNLSRENVRAPKSVHQFPFSAPR